MVQDIFFIILRTMKNFDELRSICEINSRISKGVVDDYLIQYAAGHRGLEKQMDKQFDRYRHVGKRLGRQNVNMLKSQYLAHRVFKSEGLLERFMKHPALGRFTGAERDYLLQQQEQPWRFCFSVIVDEPEDDFFMMEDVLSGERFLLYSPSAANVRRSYSPRLWFNLIGFNGSCWQTYGPVVHYQSFEPGDIWFFATELNPDLEALTEVQAEVERDPLPYMMLISGTTLPLSFHKDDQLLFLLSEHDLERLDTARLKKGFITEYDQGVYRISHKKWGNTPHFAQAFFDEEKHLLLFSAMTDRGFMSLVKDFNAFGHDFPAEPYLRVNMTMMSTASEVLNKKIVVNEYLNLFEKASDPKKDKVLEDINAFIALVLPDINAGKEPDIEEAARITGVDPETARSVVESVRGNLANVPGLSVDYPDKAAPGKKAISGKKAASKKRVPAITQLPAWPDEPVRLLSRDDKLMFDLYLYLCADEIRRMAPWEFMDEDELFGVQVPGTDRVWFVSIMGSGGQFPALAFYKGFGGLSGFLDFLAEIERQTRLHGDEEATYRASMMEGGLMTVPHLMLSFGDRENLGKADLAAIKKSGLRPRGKGRWPRIEEIVPGHVPVYPEQESLVELYLVMQQVLAVAERAEEDPWYLERENDPPTTLMVRVPSGKGPKFRWKDQYLAVHPGWGRQSYSIQVSGDSRDVLSGLPEAGQELQLDLFMLPNPVREKGSRAYFPFVLLLVDKLSGMLVSSSMLPPKPDLHSMQESIPQKVLEELIRLGHRPSKIWIRSDLLDGLLHEILEKSGCRVQWVNQMPEVDEVIRNLISNLS
jgi:Domain of unknown function (DUF6930)